MKFLLLAAAFLMVGCTRTNAALMDSSVKLARTCPDAVRLYSTPSKVPGEYTEIALLNSAGQAGWTSESGMYKSMRKKAADVGANGIILDKIDEPGAGAKVAAAIFGVGAERKGKSLAVYVPSDSLRVREVCARRT